MPKSIGFSHFKILVVCNVVSNSRIQPCTIYAAHYNKFSYYLSEKNVNSKENALASINHP